MARKCKEELVYISDESILKMLRPCPFCGPVRPDNEGCKLTTLKDEKHLYVRCDGCGCMVTGYTDSLDDASKAWNARYPHRLDIKANNIEDECIENKYELVEWVYKKVMALVEKNIKDEKDSVKSYSRKVKDKYDQVSEGIRKVSGYIGGIKEYEAALKSEKKALNDNRNNIQKIYDKMISIERKLNAGEWPGVLPPLNIDDLKMDDES